MTAITNTVPAYRASEVGGVGGAEVCGATTFGFGGVGGQNPLSSAPARAAVPTNIMKAANRASMDKYYDKSRGRNR
jgi:hypothetical protein